MILRTLAINFVTTPFCCHKVQ